MSIKPLVIYLDSSDISVLSNPSNRTPEIIEIEKKLFDLLDMGLIEFRFSHIHILEAAPISESAIPFATRRFQYLKKLCGKKCFVSYVSILEQEMLSLNTNEKFTRHHFFNDNSEWYPELDIGDMANPDRYKSIVEEEILSLPDRKSRRKATKNAFHANGELKKSFLLASGKFQQSFVDEIKSKYPITEKEAIECLKAFKSGSSKNQVIETIKNSFSDPERLVDWYSMQWGRTLPISSFLRDIGKRLSISIKESLDKSKLIYEQSDSIRSIDEYVQFQKSSFEELKFNLPKMVVNSLSKEKNITIDSNNISWSRTPSLLTGATILCNLAERSLINIVSGRNPKVSDFGDISHTFYLPYVDIFRVDSFVGSVIESSNLPFETIIEPKLAGLVETINTKLNTLR